MVGEGEGEMTWQDGEKMRGRERRCVRVEREDVRTCARARVRAGRGRLRLLLLESPPLPSHVP